MIFSLLFITDENSGGGHGIGGQEGKYIIFSFYLLVPIELTSFVILE